MNSRITRTAALIIAIYFISCKCSTKTIDCPGFEGTELKEWFNYSDNQALTFKTSAGEQQVLQLMNTFTTAPYQATGSWQNTITCESQQFFESLEKDSLSFPKLKVNLYEGANFPGSADITLAKTFINFQMVTKDSVTSIIFGNSITMVQRSTSLQLDNKTFADVYEARRDTTDNKNAGVYKVYIARQQGLVAYGEYPSLKLWVKQ